MVIVARALAGNSNCRRQADLNRAERDLQLSLNGRNNCRLTYGLARARAQAVYTLRYDPDSGSELRPLESTPRLSELLGELGFSAYKELGFDKIHLVEGVTEVLTLQQFLRAR